MLKAMLQRLAIRGVLALLLVLSGAYVVPSVPAPVSFSAQRASGRAERRPALFQWDAARTAVPPVLWKGSVELAALLKCPLLEHSLFERPPPVSLA